MGLLACNVPMYAEGGVGGRGGGGARRDENGEQCKLFIAVPIVFQYCLYNTPSAGKHPPLFEM